jgi:hypothetical protein
MSSVRGHAAQLLSLQHLILQWSEEGCSGNEVGGYSGSTGAKGALLRLQMLTWREGETIVLTPRLLLTRHSLKKPHLQADRCIPGSSCLHIPCTTSSSHMCPTPSS